MTRRLAASGSGRGAQRRDEGAAAVELALVLPVLLLVIFGIIDFGRMLNAQITVTEAAREGARAESFGADAATRVGKASEQIGAAATNVATACPETAGIHDDAVVLVTHQFEFVTPVGAIAGMFGSSSVGGSMTLTGRGVMPCAR